mmetsp:Transcript_2152/g.5626  ORF Transcript_2152/g.5626 Transcript_2152/m.5626 type:complete len:138 (-) Transcript_2152:113-526(-)
MVELLRRFLPPKAGADEQGSFKRTNDEQGAAPASPTVDAGTETDDGLLLRAPQGHARSPSPRAEAASNADAQPQPQPTAADGARRPAVPCATTALGTCAHAALSAGGAALGLTLVAMLLAALADVECAGDAGMCSPT